MRNMALRAFALLCGISVLEMPGLAASAENITITGPLEVSTNGATAYIPKTTIPITTEAKASLTSPTHESTSVLPSIATMKSTGSVHTTGNSSEAEQSGAGQSATTSRVDDVRLTTGSSYLTTAQTILETTESMLKTQSVATATSLSTSSDALTYTTDNSQQENETLGRYTVTSEGTVSVTSKLPESSEKSSSFVFRYDSFLIGLSLSVPIVIISLLIMRKCGKQKVASNFSNRTSYRIAPVDFSEMPRVGETSMTDA